MAVRTVAAQLPTTAETEGAITVHAATVDAAAITEATTDSAAVGGAAAEPVQTVAAVKLMAVYASVHRVWEQHWGTVSEYEGSVRSDYNRRGKSDAGQSWGEVLYYQTPGVYEWQFDSRKSDQLQDSKVATWEAAVADCQQAIQQLQQAKGAQHNSTLPACTPEQALSQYHP